MILPDPLDRIPPRLALTHQPIVRVALRPGDRPLVANGDRVEPGQPIIERLRHAQVGEHGLHGHAMPAPGTTFAEGASVAGSGRRALRFDGAGEVVCTLPGGRVRAVVSRHLATVESPVAGTVTALDATALSLRADGTGIVAAIAVGEPACGPLVVAVEGPSAELRAQRIDVRHAGSILVAGSRVDVESLTRARAMGVRGVIVGGVIGTDVHALRASTERQEASVHASPPFALVVLDGYGKRPIPPDAWESLTEAAGQTVGIATTPAMVLLPPDAVASRTDGSRVRVVSGPFLGRTGRVLEMIGLRRLSGGVYQESARVALDPLAPPGANDVVELPIADLERHG